MKVWITGASSGIGEACAYLYAKRGASVVVTSNEKEKLEEVAEKSFPPNGLLGCLCTVSWWLQPTSSKIKGPVSKTPSQLTLIGIAVGPELCRRSAWAYSGVQWWGVWHRGGGLFLRFC